MRWLILALALIFTSNLAATELKIYTHTTEGQVTLDKSIVVEGREHAGQRAFYVELVRAILKELGLNTPIEEVPLKRGKRMLENEQNVVLFNINRTPDAENTASWVGPIKDKGSGVFYESVRRPSGIKTMSEAKNLPVCVALGQVHDEALTKEGFTNLTRVANYEQCFKMLISNRVLLVVAGKLDLKKRLKRAGVKNSEVRATKAVLEGHAGYIAFSKDIPQSEVKRWAAALKKIKDSGLFKTLYKKYAI